MEAATDSGKILYFAYRNHYEESGTKRIYRS